MKKQCIIVGEKGSSLVLSFFQSLFFPVLQNFADNFGEQENFGRQGPICGDGLKD